MLTSAEMAAAVKEHGSKAAAARALGIPRETLRDRLRETEYTLPDGQAVKAESVLLDAEGRVKARWVKTKEASGAGLVDGLKAAFAAYTGAAPMIAAPVYTDDDLLTVYPLPDLHWGLYAWHQDAGADWDTTIAEKTILAMIGDLVAQSRPSKRAIVLGLGDYFHCNDRTNATPGSKHALDSDGRWPKVFAAGARLATKIIDMVARRHDQVEAVFLAGNHDPDSAVCLTVALDLFYSANPRITVHSGAGLYWYHRHGQVLLAATHGHTVSPDRLVMAMATDRAEDWGQTQFRQAFMGHIHHERAKEVGPVRVEYFGTPIPRDAWAQGAGFRSGRSMSALTFHAGRGEIGRHRVNIGPGSAAA